MRRSRTRKRVSLGIIFWIAFILFILVFFLLSRQNIQQVVETTGLLDILQERLGVDSDKPHRSPEELIPLPDITLRPETETDTTDRVQPSTEPETIDPADRPELLDAEPVPETTERPQGKPEADSRQEPYSPDSQQTLEDRETREAILYYINVNDAGSILTKKIVRTMQRTNTPLSANLQALIAGPSADELSTGVLNLIPPGSQLLSASISNRVAYLNFNENFRFNSLGTEGIIAQLQQIVYTATEFSTIDRVQFLINGQQLDYLGGDGVYIGQPLGRNSFR